jgi:hypothetical protein
MAIATMGDDSANGDPGANRMLARLRSQAGPEPGLPQIS